jgi:dolichyl-phosphate beta-glucosyltransferase
MIVTCVIPALNEGDRLPAFLRDLGEELLSGPPQPAIEIVVVDDGSTPDHLARHKDAVDSLARALSAGPHRARLHSLPENHGKARAVRVGWAEASREAEWLGFVDADGAVPAREMARLTRMLPLGGFDALAGSRIRMAGHTIRRSPFRHFQGRLFATAVEWLLRLGFYDPQCGLKFFRAGALRPWLPRLREETWLLDVEVLALIANDGGRLREEAIDWSDPGGSKMTFGLDALKMLTGLWKLHRRIPGRQPVEA